MQCHKVCALDSQNCLLFFFCKEAKQPICQKYIHAEAGKKASHNGWQPVAGNMTQNNSCVFSFSVQVHYAITKPIRINMRVWNLGVLRDLELFTCNGHKTLLSWTAAFSTFKYYQQKWKPLSGHWMFSVLSNRDSVIIWIFMSWIWWMLIIWLKRLANAVLSSQQQIEIWKHNNEP